MMSFDFNGFVEFFGSIYKVAFILFLSGLFLILSNDQIREVLFLNDFIKTYGVYIGFVTIFSGIILVVFIIEEISNNFKYKYLRFKTKSKIIKILKDLSFEEKNILIYFLIHKTQFSNLGIDLQFNGESHPIKMLVIKNFLSNVGTIMQPYYKVSNAIWDIMQTNPREIFYEDIFWEKN